MPRRGIRVRSFLSHSALALMVAWFIGKALELEGEHRDYQANTIKQRLVLSTIFVGLKTIDDRRVLLICQGYKNG